MDEIKDIESEEPVYALIMDEDDDIEIVEDEAFVVLEEENISVVSEQIDSEEFTDYQEILDVDESELEDEVLVNTFVEKRRAQFQLPKISKRKFKLYSFFIIVSILSICILVMESPIFSIDKVQIIQLKNTVPLSSDELTQLKKNLQSIKDQQMYRSNFAASNASIGKLNFVKTVKFEKDWPSTVKVTITHRVAIATIKTDKGYVLIDDENVIFAKVPELQQGLPVFKGFDEITFSKKINDGNYVTILKNSPDEIITQIAAVEKKDSKYIVTLTDGIMIKLGDTSLLKEKLAIAWSIILTKNRAELGYIDVSVPSLPVSGVSKV